MCLGVPGKIIRIYDDNSIKMSEVDFNGVTMKVCLETTPQAKIGDYVIVHAGFAINLLEESEALETLSMLDEIAKLGEQEQT
ncbi:MAG TPA: hydrogenase assembly protein HypC [Anaerolineaceae bacterium]|uniref:Hydrogenase formation protein HypC n=1 Tax=Anaerolinea thermophila TaxID=167964 RepID=A0A101FZ27_9CHLR|nr:MAG: Hydrogenase formation protein HypC [Anaerolinea thermophila]HAF60817.1 hydrogenase assembly protein HypC [Anaerolineaceae bacterium]